MRRKTPIKITENRSVEARVKAISQEFEGGSRRGGDWWFPPGEGIGSRPVSRVLSRMVIHLGHASPHASSGLPGNTRGRRAAAARAACFPIWPCSGWGLPCHCCCQQRGALLPHLFTLAGPAWRDLGGMFSVALSVGSHPPGVTWHPVLRSPDFPPPPQHGESDHPADSRIQDSGLPPRAQARTRP